MLHVRMQAPIQDHGDANNIVEEHIRKAGQTETIAKAGVATAKENLLELMIQRTRRADNPKQDYNQ